MRRAHVEELIAENTLLRQQLIVAARTVKKPRFAAHERGLLVSLARLVPRWREALLVVKPDTILRWHREGFRLFGRARSRPPEASTSRITPETVELIRRLADQNRLWGAERIRGELLKLGIKVAKRTIQKHMRRVRRPRPWGQSWSMFLRNHMHQMWACDFLQIYDIWLPAADARGSRNRWLAMANDHDSSLDGAEPNPRTPTHTSYSAAVTSLRRTRTLPSTTSSATVSPLVTSPRRIASARGASTRRAIVRFIGRAPRDAS